MGANNQPESKSGQYSQISSNSTNNYGQINNKNQSQLSFQKIKQNEEFMQRIQAKYPQVTLKEWQLFLQSSNNGNSLSELMNMPEAEFKAALLKYITVQQTKYTSLCEKMRKARMEQISYQASLQATAQPSSDISAASMNQLLQQADILSKIDKMRDFFLLKENNSLQLSVHVTSLVTAIKNVLDFPDEEHKHYFTIAKNITAFAQNLSRLCVLAGFTETHNDEECTILYYESKDTALLRIILSYLRQNYQSYVKTMKQLEDEVRQAGREIKQNNKTQENVVQGNSSTNEIVQQQQMLSSANTNVPSSSQGIQTNTQNTDLHQLATVLSEQVDVQTDGSAVCIKMKEGAESRAVRERVLAQLEAKKRREDKACQQQEISQKPSNNSAGRTKNVQDPRRFSERMIMEMQTLKGSESQRIEQLSVQAINEFRISRHLNPLMVDNSIDVACSIHSSYLAQNEILNHQDIENRSREINIISPYSTLYELVASSIPADSSVRMVFI